MERGETKMQAATQAIETTGTTDAQHHLVLDETLPITGPTRVRVGRLMPEESDLNGTEWLRAAADPAICHGEPTFRGTRIMVADVLEQVEGGMAYEAIIEVALRDWQGCDCKSRSRKSSAARRL